MNVKDWLSQLGLEHTGYPDYISVSQIGKWLKCPLSWLFNYASDASAVYPERLLIGSATHAAWETANRLKQNGLVIDGSQFELLYESSDKLVDEVDSLTYPDVNLSSVKSQVRKIVSNSTPIINELPTPLMIETPIEGLMLADTQLVGYIDIFNEADEVLDIKVGSKYKTEAQAMVDLQLAIYAWAMGTRKVGFVSISSASGGVRVIRHEHEKDNLDKFITYADWVTNNINTAKMVNDTNLFVPNPNGYWCGSGCSHCIYCPYSELRNP